LKPFIAWVKFNWIIVVLCVVVLASLPTAFVFSGKWNTKIKTTQEEAANKELKKIQAATVEYVVPTYVPGTEAVNLRAEPNTIVTAWFKEQRTKLAGEAGTVLERAVAFNKGAGPESSAVGRSPHVQLVDGLFPGGADQVDKVRAFEDAIITEKGGRDPYIELLNNIGAGSPPLATRVALVLDDLNTRERERITENRRELTPDERETHRKALLDRRFAEYQAAARKISVYAGPEIFATSGVDREGGRRSNRFFGEGPNYTGKPTLRDIDTFRAEEKPMRYFVWQWDLWAVSDVLDAVKLANDSSVRLGNGVEGSVVKRIIKIGLMEPEGLRSSEADQNQIGMGALDGATASDPTSEVPGMAPLDKNVSFTGRAMGTWNPVFDVRRIELEAVVSSAKLPEFLAAIPRTNFMTVTQMTIEPVDVWSHMRLGYFYGSEHVVEIKLSIESVWLREWTKPLMPKSFKARLGIEEPLAEEAPS